MAYVGFRSVRLAQGTAGTREAPDAESDTHQPSTKGNRSGRKREDSKGMEGGGGGSRTRVRNGPAQRHRKPESSEHRTQAGVALAAQGEPGPVTEDGQPAVLRDQLDAV